MGMIDTSRSALLVFQRALQTTSNNIANVNTEGYSRQSVNLKALGSTNPADASAPGAGVEIASINRAFDKVLTDSVRYDSAAYGQTEMFGNLATEIDRLFANSESGLSTQIQNYFGAIQDVSNDPTSIATRQVMMGEAEMLTARFRELDGSLAQISTISNTRLSATVGEINSYTQQIASVNAKIQDSGDNIPNDLLDERDLLITKLSEKVSVTTVQSNDGSTSVFAGSGQALVIGASAEQISIKQSEYASNGFRIVMGKDGSGSDITDQMGGGVIGGILQFQEDILRPAQNEIGRMAAVIGESFNELHRGGYDLDGNTGNDLFSFADPSVAESSLNTGTAQITASFVTTIGDAYDVETGGLPGDADDIAQLRGNWQASDYELVDEGATWSLTRLSDNTNVALTTNGNGTLTAADGFVINVNPDASVGDQEDGDSFLIRPFQYSASDIEIAIDNPREFAAANSIDPAYELEYLGTPADSWKITRLSDGQSTSVLGTLGGSVSISDGFSIDLPTGITSGQKYQIHPFDSDSAASGGLTVTVDDRAQIIRRNVLNMDNFNTEADPVGVRSGNNENALAFVNLQTDKLIGSGTSTINDAYNQLVSSVGIQTNQATISMRAQGIMLDQSKLARDNVSGVNLDEEAADLLRFQQAYQAAAKVMAAADQMFKTLMNSLG